MPPVAANCKPTQCRRETLPTQIKDPTGQFPPMELAEGRFGDSCSIDDTHPLVEALLLDSTTRDELEAAIALCNLQKTENPLVNRPALNKEVAGDVPTGSNQKNTGLDELDDLDAMCITLFGDRKESAVFVDAALDSDFRCGGDLSEGVLRDDLHWWVILDVLAFGGPMLEERPSPDCKGSALRGMHPTVV